MIQIYCQNHGARFADQLAPYFGRLETRDFNLDTDQKLNNILRATADDPIMLDTQDMFFDQVYWKPAASAAQRMGITSALGVSIVYDGKIHGSWERMRDRTNEQEGSIENLGERDWLVSFLRSC